MQFHFVTLLCNDKCTKILYSVLTVSKLLQLTVLKWILKFDILEEIPVFTALLCHIRIRYIVEKHISIKKIIKHQVLVQCGTMWSAWKSVLDV